MTTAGEEPASEGSLPPSLPTITYSQLGESPQCAKVLYLCDVVVLKVKVGEGDAGGEGGDTRDEIVIEIKHCEVVADGKTFL